MAQALSGTWAWDSDEDGVADTPAQLGAVQFGTQGLYDVAALYSSSDARVSSYFANGAGTPVRSKAEVAVFSPRTDIDVAPTIAALPYGSTLSMSDVATSLARVVATEAGTNAQTAIYDESAGIRLGTWSLKAGTSVAVTSTTGTQDVVLVFTPNDAVDWSNPSAGGYAGAEVTVAVSVTPVDPTPSLDVSAPPVVLKYGDALSSSSSLLASGLSFSAPGNVNIAGSLEWVTPALVPGSVSALTDEQGNDPKNGKWLDWVKFTPDAAYGSAYGEVLVRLEIAVIANDPTLDSVAGEIVDLEGALDAIAGIGSGATGVDGRENYPPAALNGADAAAATATAGLAGGGSGPAGALTQTEAEVLLSALDAAKAALVHTHPVLANSAGSTAITAYGTGLIVEVQGVFATVAEVKLDGVPFVLDYVSATAGALGSTPARIDLYANGSGGAALGAPLVGTVTEGSAIVELLPAYVDTLGDATHSLEVQFADGFGAGSGIAPFAVARADTPGSGSNGSGDGADGGALVQTGDTVLPIAFVGFLANIGVLLLLSWRWRLRRIDRWMIDR
jgi:hypothetical protein